MVLICTGIHVGKADERAIGRAGRQGAAARLSANYCRLDSGVWSVPAKFLTLTGRSRRAKQSQGAAASSWTSVPFKLETIGAIPSTVRCDVGGTARYR